MTTKSNKVHTENIYSLATVEAIKIPKQPRLAIRNIAFCILNVRDQTE